MVNHLKCKYKTKKEKLLKKVSTFRLARYMCNIKNTNWMVVLKMIVL